MNSSFIEIAESDYLKLGKLVTQRYGIKLPIQKKVMFQARLQSRLRELGMASFEQYCKFILTPENTDAELKEMIAYVSTNKTDFFREEQHFDLLLDKILPEMLEGENELKEPFLNCWSAGCSEGQEAFSLAMVIDSYRQEYAQDMDFYILGTDVSEKVLEVARKGIFPFAESERIPKHLLKKYVLRSKNAGLPRIKIVNSLCAKVLFTYGNLMDDEYPVRRPFQIIFLRNTLIYFNYIDQTAILQKVLKHLELGGYLFIGYSESLVNRNLPIQMIVPSVYQKVKL